MSIKPVPVETREIIIELEIPVDMSPEDRQTIKEHLEAGDLAQTSGLDYCITDSWWCEA